MSMLIEPFRVMTLLTIVPLSHSAFPSLSPGINRLNQDKKNYWKKLAHEAFFNSLVFNHNFIAATSLILCASAGIVYRILIQVWHET